MGLWRIEGRGPKFFDFDFDFDFDWERRARGMGVFDPEKMAVYRLARRHSRAVRELIGAVDGRGYSDLIQQLRSSTVSIPANLLEAAGEWRPGKRLNYLMIAKGSTWECWAHTDSLVDFGLVPAAAIAEVRDIQQQITALLITTIRALESADTRSSRFKDPPSPPPAFSS
jgi:four helix bundle protein